MNSVAMPAAVIEAVEFAAVVAVAVVGPAAVDLLVRLPGLVEHLPQLRVDRQPALRARPQPEHAELRHAVVDAVAGGPEVVVVPQPAGPALRVQRPQQQCQVLLEQRLRLGGRRQVRPDLRPHAHRVGADDVGVLRNLMAAATSGSCGLMPEASSAYVAIAVYPPQFVPCMLAQSWASPLRWSIRSPTGLSPSAWRAGTPGPVGSPRRSRTARPRRAAERAPRGIAATARTVARRGRRERIIRKTSAGVRPNPCRAAHRNAYYSADRCAKTTAARCGGARRRLYRSADATASSAGAAAGRAEQSPPTTSSICHEEHSPPQWPSEVFPPTRPPLPLPPRTPCPRPSTSA